MSVYRVERKKGHSWMVDFEFTNPTTGRQDRLRRIAKGATTKREALQRERELRHEAEKPQRQKATNAPFGDFAGHWMTTRRVDWKPSVLRGYEQILRVHLVPWFGDLTLRQIGPESVQQLKAGKLRGQDNNNGLSPKTVNNILGVLSSLFEDAKAWGYADSNPVGAVKKAKSDKGLDDFSFWTSAESTAFLTTIKTEPRLRRWHPLFLTALHTGMRQGELSALRVGDLDFERKIIRVVRSFSHGVETTPKSGMSRTIPMSGTVHHTLRNHVLDLDKSRRVFLSNSGIELTSNRIKNHLWMGIRIAGVKRIRFHDLRHSFASQLVISGVSIYKVQKLLGHTDVKTTMRYAHLSPEAQEEAILVLDQ